MENMNANKYMFIYIYTYIYTFDLFSIYSFFILLDIVKLSLMYRLHIGYLPQNCFICGIILLEYIKLLNSMSMNFRMVDIEINA